MASQVPLPTLARLLVLTADVVLLVGRILQATKFGALMDFSTNSARLRGLTGIVVGILVGFLAIGGSNDSANSLQRRPRVGEPPLRRD
jgi:hypothetical protein